VYRPVASVPAVASPPVSPISHPDDVPKSRAVVTNDSQKIPLLDFGVLVERSPDAIDVADSSSSSDMISVASFPALPRFTTVAPGDKLNEDHPLEGMVLRVVAIENAKLESEVEKKVLVSQLESEKAVIAKLDDPGTEDKLQEKRKHEEVMSKLTGLLDDLDRFRKSLDHSSAELGRHFDEALSKCEEQEQQRLKRILAKEHERSRLGGLGRVSQKKIRYLTFLHLTHMRTTHPKRSRSSISLLVAFHVQVATMCWMASSVISFCLQTHSSTNKKKRCRSSGD
jgi:hypothetical protein